MYRLQRWHYGYGRLPPPLDGDKGLLVDRIGVNYGLGSFFKKPLNNTKKSLHIQYEVQTQNPPDCSELFLKIMPDSLEELSDISRTTPYTILFGPYFCDEKSLVYFTLLKDTSKDSAYKRSYTFNY